ncbi:MAG: Unknown protein [uncultured Sulfurovum sp.]|uniref:Uncharacterized protein n=1 Tax=uncultured Sulfurovum sp. TaxID=269237 RepID=A0A6S6TAX9_9BACT|nr:MAG: Unknown protein [uncultured Sulfurovum sp.]
MRYIELAEHEFKYNICIGSILYTLTRGIEEVKFKYNICIGSIFLHDYLTRLEE